MPRVLVIHYDPDEGALLASRIRRENFDADVYRTRGAAGMPGIRAAPPDAIVFDLSRMPSYGRAFGALLRQQKSTRHIPLVYLEGDPAKTRVVRRLLPDAVYTDVLHLGAALRKAIAEPPAEPVLPDHSRTPVAGKLGIKEGTVVALLQPPEGFPEALGRLPKKARLRASTSGADVILLFVKSAAVLGRALAPLAREMKKGQTLWVIWPKKASKIRCDLALPGIAEMCSAVGLSGYKICAVDNTWSGVAVTLPRVSGRGRRRSVLPH